MKKIFPFLLLLLVVTSCKYQNVNSAYHPFSDNLSFKIRTIVNTITLDKGGTGYTETHVSGKGTAFKQVQFIVKNASTVDEIINFKEILLLDSSNNRYHATMCVPSMRLISDVEKFEHKVKAGKSTVFMVNFAPAFPKDEMVTKVLVKENIIKL